MTRTTTGHRAVRRLLLGVLLLLGASLPVLSRPEVSAASAAPTVETVPPLGSPHPSVPGMFFFGEYGWGRLTFESLPPQPTTVLMLTPWYSDATSRPRIGWGETLLGYPIVARNSPLVPEVVDGHRQGCRYVDRATGSIKGYDDGPCEHRNKWARGPQDGFSYCVYKRCQSVGHSSQGGWSTFLAHSELWARVEYVTPPPAIGFVPCGEPCDATPTTTPTTPPTTPVPTPPTVPPTTIPGSDASGGAVDPCTLPGVDCTRELCDRSGSCAPVCGNVPCTPPSVCVTSPQTPACGVEADLEGVSALVVLDAPEVFIARGVAEPQSVRVVEVGLRCDGRPCPSSRLDLDTSSLEVEGVLELASMSARYRACRSSTVVSCEFRVTERDDSTEVAVGDRVLAVFYTPTRTGEVLRVFLDGPRAVIDVHALLPVRTWKQTAAGFVLEDTGETEWQYARSVAIPVVVAVRDGTPEGKVYSATPGAEGLRRLVIGTVGRE